MIPQQEMLPHYTYDDYVLWEGKWELISGIPYAMSPSPVPKHQRISASLSAEITNELSKCGSGPCKLYHPIDFKVKEDTVLQPDLLIVCGQIKKKFLDFPPALVVEILSPATAMKDRHTKYPIYERQGVKYFIIISPEKEVAEIYELIDGEYDLLQKGHSIKQEFSIEECRIELDFSKIW
jgi:Uma2 family endonuclease